MACAFRPSARMASCNGLASDGCEAAVSCASCCGVACNPSSVCTNGVCTVGRQAVCATVSQFQTATLTCPTGLTVRSVTFASYGTPTGSCGSFATSSCNGGNNDTKVVKNLCVGNASCSVFADDSVFGTPCSGTKRLYVELACGC